MENLIIILSVLLNIALIISLAVYMKKYNNTHDDLTMSIENYSNLVKEKSLLEYEKKSLKYEQQVYAEKTNELIQKCDRQNAEIESLQSINNTLLNDNRKLSDEISELKKPKHKKS